MSNDGNFDVNEFLKNMDDYSDPTGSNDNFDTDLDSNDNFLDMVADDSRSSSNYGGDDISSMMPSSGDDDDDGIDFDFDNQGTPDAVEDDDYLSVDSDPDEEDPESYLQKFEIEDENLKTVQLADYNIQEDIVIDDTKSKLPIKEIIFGILFLASIFFAVCAAIFFNKYGIINEEVIDCVWTNGNYSIVDKTYEVSMADIHTGDTVMLCMNPNDFVKEYHYAQITEKKFKSPREIEVLVNATGKITYISLDKIAYVVVINEDDKMIAVDISNGQIQDEKSDSNDKEVEE